MEPLGLYSSAVLLILIIDPFGNLVTINALLKDIPAPRRRKLILRECLLAWLILSLFFFVGNHLLTFLGIRPASLSISGGFVLFLIALRMVFPSRDNPIASVDGEPLLVPIAVPLIAGPSALAVLLLMATRDPAHSGRWLAALAIAMSFSTLLLWLSPFFFERLGNSLTTAIERLVGMVLIMLAVQMLLDGFSDYLAS